MAAPTDQLRLDGVTPPKPPYRIPSMAEIRAVPRNGLTVVSTFSGCGGSCLGFEWAGYHVLWASEFITAARETYLANHPGVLVDHRDIREVTPEEILDTVGLRRGELDVFEGSPPCSSFSMAGRREDGWGETDWMDDGHEQGALHVDAAEEARLLVDIEEYVKRHGGCSRGDVADELRRRAPDEETEELWLADLDRLLKRLYDSDVVRNAGTAKNLRLWHRDDAEQPERGVKAYSDGAKQRTDDLFFEYARILDGLAPRAFVAENVVGITTGDVRETFLEVILERLRTAAAAFGGYRVAWKILNAADHGVPQNRHRVIFIGVRRDVSDEPVPPFPPKNDHDPYTIRDAIGLAFPPHRLDVANTGRGVDGRETHRVIDAEAPVPTVQIHGSLHTRSELSVPADAEVIPELRPPDELPGLPEGRLVVSGSSGGNAGHQFGIVEPATDGLPGLSDEAKLIGPESRERRFGRPREMSLDEPMDTVRAGPAGGGEAASADQLDFTIVEPRADPNAPIDWSASLPGLPEGRLMVENAVGLKSSSYEEREIGHSYRDVSNEPMPTVQARRAVHLEVHAESDFPGVPEGTQLGARVGGQDVLASTDEPLPCLTANGLSGTSNRGGEGMLIMPDETSRVCPTCSGKRPDGCETCGGAGRVAISALTEEQAVSLEGYAIGDEWDRLKPGESSQMRPCEDCGGSGKTGDATCATCGGRGKLGFFSLIRPDPDKPVGTVTQTGGTTGAAGVTHPLVKRKFTLAELRRLCGFPDDFVLTGSYRQGWERMGRAVPPPMMRAVAETLATVLLPKGES